MTISDEISNEVATAILTHQRELNRAPRELLDLVIKVHETLRELDAKVREARAQQLDHFLFQSNADENKEVESQTKPRALVVDDSPDIAFMLVTILLQAGYEALMATSGIEALRLVK